MKRDIERENRGLSAFALLQGLDDDTVLSATLPAPKKRGFFAAVASRPMAAMLVSVAVALTVLGGVVAASRLGVLNPPDIDPATGEQGTSGGTEADPGTGISGVIPPLEETPDNPQKSAVSVVSDGITVYPKGYCVYISEQRRNEQGELVGLDGDGYGAVYQLAEIWDELPTLKTAGNDFDAVLPDHMTLRSVRVFEMVEVQTKTFEEIASTVDGPNLSVDPMGYLSTLRGFYTVVLEVYHETNYSEDEYTKGVDEYAFKLDVDPTMNEKAPVRVIHGDKTYFPTGYLLSESYYDAELKQNVTKRYDGATYQLQSLLNGMVTATVYYTGSITQEGALSLYLAPFYDLQEITVYDGNLNEIVRAQSTEPLEILSSWGVGDYYVIISATFAGTGATSVMEFPIHIKVVEEREEESTPAGDVGETPLPPRVSVGSNYGGLDFGNTGHSREYHEGYMLWTEEWYDGGMVSGDGFGATGQLSDISDGLPVLRHNAGEEPFLRVHEEGDTLTRIYVYRDDHSFYFDAEAAPILASLPVGRYIIVLRVETQGDYVEEADAYERTCTEYAFWLEVVDSPKTNPRVVVSGGGQSAVFETEEDGFLAWTAYRLGVAISWMPRVEGTPAASVIFADDDAMRALPDMEITYGTPLALSLDAAGDALFKVILYDAKGEIVAEGLDLSVVGTLENEGWDQHVIVVLQVISRVSETEQACYEYAFELDIVQP